MEAEADRRIVVGVDGSPSSREALRWAATQARVTGGWLEAVAAWQIPPTLLIASSQGYVGGFEGAPLIDFASLARGILEESLAEVLGGDAALRVTSKIIQGHPATVLVARSSGAELLVVGSRGRGGFAGLLLGSVSTYVAANAHCPVTIVRHIDGEP